MMMDSQERRAAFFALSANRGYRMAHSTQRIWENFSGQLRQFIRSRVADVQLTDDLLQDVFVKIHAQADTLQDSAKIRGWIYQIARNTIIDRYGTSIDFHSITCCCCAATLWKEKKNG
jgi:DNA-directed RNA polymerase specialized sigma24 family protein